MRKFVIATTLSLSLALGGCQFFKNIEAALQTGDITASVVNPVTRERLDQLEQVAVLVFTGLNAWKQACISGTLPVTCKQQIASVQVYTRQIPPYLAQLRIFVKTNDQVNAIVLFNNITSLISNIRTQAAASGINITATGS